MAPAEFIPVCETTGLPASRLGLELRESTLARFPEAAADEIAAALRSGRVSP